MISIIYASRATLELSESDLDALLAQSRRNNADQGVTGMLLYRDGRFLQVLEGPDQAVWGRMNLIETDARHGDLRVLLEESVEERRFPEWSMAFPRVSAAETERIPGYRDAFDDLGADAEGDSDADEAVDPVATPKALRELTRWFQERLRA